MQYCVQAVRAVSPHVAFHSPRGHSPSPCTGSSGSAHCENIRHTQVVDASEVRAVIDKLPAAKAFLHALYDLQYSTFFPAFLDVVDTLEADLYLSEHVKHYMHEARVVAYVQYLTSYKSVTIPAMAQAFGVSEGFIDNEVWLRPAPVLWNSCHLIPSSWHVSYDAAHVAAQCIKG